MSETTRCRSCGERIKFLPTESGKTMPVNVEPDSRGNLAIRQDALGQEMAIHIGKPSDQLTLYDTELRYRSHFVTCPDRQVWRRS